MGRLDGKVAIITGGARGQGASEARLLAEEGAKVVFGDIRDEEGRQVEAEIREAGGDATYIHLDVTSEEDWQNSIDLAESRYGRLDVLVNNAAILNRKGIEDLTLDEWNLIMAVNAKGVFLGTKYAIPAMRRAGGGSIINISSGAGIAPSAGTSPSYSATKGAVRLLSKATAVQYAKENIRCNSLHPGPIDTPMVWENPQDPSTQGDYITRVPLARRGTPDEIAYGVLYLASDESSFVTGAELVIDGGRTAQ